MKYRIGILGGSFDPIHNGHIAIANHALKELNLDEILFIPTLQNPLKKHTETSYQDRCNMIEIALLDKMRLYKDDSIYTIDLIKNLKLQYPKTQFYFIIGNDSLQTLPNWKQIDLLVKELQFVVVERNDTINDTNYPIIKLSALSHEASSTKIRNGEFKYLNIDVIDYILNHQLYLDNIVKNHISKQRYIHTKGVVKKALQLCDIHHKDTQFKKDMYVASILHDICKEFNEKKLKIYMKKYFPYKLSTPLAVWHAYVGSVYIQEKLCIKNERVINAIYNHTILEDSTDFNLILKLADNLEENRKVIFEDVNNLAKTNLYEAYTLLQNKFK